jgi:hypothetical protein
MQKKKPYIETTNFRLQLQIEPLVDASIDAKVLDWLSQQEPAVSGHGGHNVTFAVACRLIHGFDLDADTAYRFFAEWNRFCEPPWSEAELWHKLHDAEEADSYKQRGYMLRKHYKKNELAYLEADLHSIDWDEAIYLPVYEIDSSKAVYLETCEVEGGQKPL